MLGKDQRRIVILAVCTLTILCVMHLVFGNLWSGMDIILCMVVALVIGTSFAYLKWLQNRTQELAMTFSFLTASKKRTDLILASMGEGMYGIDIDGCVTFINPAALKMLGYTQQELLGVQIRPLIEVPNSQQIKRFGSATSSAFVTNIQNIEVVNELYRRKNGSCFHVSYSVSPLLNGQEVTGAVVVFRDISEQLHQEQELRKNAELMHAILSNSNSLFCLKSPEGHYMMVNKRFCEVFALQESYIIGKTDDKLFSAPLAKEKHLSDQQVLASGTQLQVEETVPEATGLRYYVTVKFPLRADDHSIYAIGAISTDITERAEQELRLQDTLSEIESINRELESARQAAEEANIAKSSFLANMSHEIRTPLNGVIGMASLLQQTELNPKQRKYVERITLSSMILLELINDILDLSKIESGKLTIEKIAFNLSVVLDNIEQLFHLQALEKGVELKVQISADVASEVIGDPTRFRQIVSNLVANAIKFTTKGSVLVDLIVLNRDNQTQQLRLNVTDTGIGIPKEKIGNLFQKFNQADPSTTRKYGGTGLGLALSKELVRALGGQIGVQSQEGKGSTFWVEIPLKIAQKETSSV